jgi:hypothetical protein
MPHSKKYSHFILFLRVTSKIGPNLVSKQQRGILNLKVLLNVVRNAKNMYLFIPFFFTFGVRYISILKKVLVHMAK